MNCSPFAGSSALQMYSQMNNEEYQEDPQKWDVNQHQSNKDLKVDGGGKHGANKHQEVDSLSEAESRLFSARIEDYKRTSLSRMAIPGAVGRGQQVDSASAEYGAVIREIKAQSLSGGDLHNQQDFARQGTCDGRVGLIQTHPTFIQVQGVRKTPAYESIYLKGEQNPDYFNAETETNESELHQADQNEAQLQTTARQSIFVWGSNGSGQLGLSSGNFGQLDIPSILSFHQRIQEVSCGEQHTAMVTVSKQLFVMGSNSCAQLGLGSPNQLARCTVPTLVQSLAHLQVISVSCGANHTFSISQEIIGERNLHLYSWGDNRKGQAGISNADIVLSPHKLSFDNDSKVTINKISAGKEHSFFLDTQMGAVYACGETNDGQTGMGYCQDVIRAPARVTSLMHENVTAIACGVSHTLAVNSTGQVFATGANFTGQLGLGHTQPRFSFDKIPSLSNIVQVGASTHSCAIDLEGRLFRWGQAIKGVYLVPLKIASPRPIHFDEISMGADFAIVKNEQGEVFTYGVNENGQLGQGDNESRQNMNTLVQLNQNGPIKSMSAGSDFVVCLVDLNSQDLQQTQEPVPKIVPASVIQYNVSASEAQQRLASEFTRVKNLTKHNQAHTHSSELVTTINTQQTAQNAKDPKAIHHENLSSQETSSWQAAESSHEQLPTERTYLDQQQQPQQIRPTDVSMAEVVQPPYTKSPYNDVDRRIIMNNTACTSFHYAKSNQPLNHTTVAQENISQVKTTSNHENTNEVFEQVTLVEKLDLQSDFARGRSRSSERPTQINSNAPQSLNHSAYDNSVNQASNNQQTAGMQKLNDSILQHQQEQRQQQRMRSTSPAIEIIVQQLKNLPPMNLMNQQEDTIMHNVSQERHQPMPSFSAQEPSQFKTRTCQGIQQSRQSHTIQSLENTGAFITPTLAAEVASLEQEEHINQQQQHYEPAQQQQQPVQQQREQLYKQREFSCERKTLNSSQHQITSSEMQMIVEESSRYRVVNTSIDDQLSHASQVQFMSTSEYGGQRQPQQLIQVGAHQLVSSSGGFMSATTSECLPAISTRLHQSQVMSQDSQHHPQYQNMASNPSVSLGTFNKTYQAIREHHQGRVQSPKPTPDYDSQQLPLQKSRRNQRTRSHNKNHKRVSRKHRLATNESEISQLPLLTKDTMLTHDESRGSTSDGKIQHLYQPPSTKTNGQSYGQQQQQTSHIHRQQAVLQRNDCLKCGHHQLPSQPHFVDYNVQQMKKVDAKARAKSVSRSRSRGQHHISRNNMKTAISQERRPTITPAADDSQIAQCPSCHTMSLQKPSFKTRDGVGSASVNHHVQQHPQPDQSSQERQKQLEKQKLGDKRLRKKYKRLKQERNRVQMEQLAATEKLKIRIHELQSMIQHRDTAMRSESLQKSEGYHALVGKFSQELSTLQESVCNLERSAIAKDAQIKQLSREGTELKASVTSLKSELAQVHEVNETLQQESDKLIDEVEQLIRNKRDQELTVSTLREQLESKSRLCLDSEVSLAHLSKTLDDLRVNFEGAKTNANQVMHENDHLHGQMRTNEDRIEAHEVHIQKLKYFIDELESNNRELVRHIDQKNVVQANEYRQKVSHALSQPRRFVANAASLLSKPENAKENTHPHQQQNMLSKSHSPLPRLQFNAQPDIQRVQASVVPQVDSKTQQLHGLRQKNQSPVTATCNNTRENSRQRYISICEDEKQEQMEAQHDLGEALVQMHRGRGVEPTKPVEQYLITRAGQLLDQVQNYQKRLTRRTANMDPRERLNGEAPHSPSNHTRSQSPAPDARHHYASHLSRHSLERSISGDANSPRGVASPSQNSLEVQYQKVTSLAPPVQSSLQQRLPDIRNVLASTPGKSRISGSGVRGREEYTSPAAFIRKDELAKSTEVSLNQQQAPAPVYPKVTGSMLRSQLQSMTESLAQLKRTRVQLGGGIQVYEQQKHEQ